MHTPTYTGVLSLARLTTHTKHSSGSSVTLVQIVSIKSCEVQNTFIVEQHEKNR